MDCDHSNDKENVTQKAKLPLTSVVKMYFLKVANGMEGLLNENNSKHFEFTSEVFDTTEINMKIDMFIAVLGTNMMTSHGPNHKSSSIQMHFDKSGQ